jgi:hypothetical protein
MCNFISWYEKDGVVFFLTDDDLATKAGKKLRKELGDQYAEDIKGHGAIARYFELNEWVVPMDAVRREVGDSRCPDFSTPNNFPPQIVAAIKNCNLTQIGQMPESVLLKRGLDLIKKDAKRGEAEAKWKEAYAKWGEADAKRKEADAKWREAYAKWREAYAKRKEAYAKWREAEAKWREADAKRGEAYAKREEAYAKRKEADAKWREAYANVFWKVFANPKNRKKVWR